MCQSFVSHGIKLSLVISFIRLRLSIDIFFIVNIIYTKYWKQVSNPTHFQNSQKLSQKTFWLDWVDMLKIYFGQSSQIFFKELFVRLTGLLVILFKTFVRLNRFFFFVRLTRLFFFKDFLARVTRFFTKSIWLVWSYFCSNTPILSEFSLD